jgi:hypothetical protein
MLQISRLSAGTSDRFGTSQGKKVAPDEFTGFSSGAVNLRKLGRGAAQVV